MGREFELKYSASPATLENIRALWQDWEEISMETTYFDTPSASLAGKNCTMRRRMENGTCVCTVKTPSVGYGRGEWDTKSPWCEETANHLFAQAGLPPIAFSQLQTVCGARFTRLAKTVELPGCVAEIALDSGVLMGGGREIPLYEVELELKDGSEAALMGWAQHFAQRFSLKAERKSKFRRASDLAKGE